MQADAGCAVPVGVWLRISHSLLLFIVALTLCFVRSPIRSKTTAQRRVLESALSSAALLSAFQQCESDRQSAAMDAKLRQREEKRAAALERRRARARENVRRMQAAAAQSLAALAAPPERPRLAALDQLQHWQLQRGPSPRVRVCLPAVISPRRMAKMMVGESKVAASAGAPAADSCS